MVCAEDAHHLVVTELDLADGQVAVAGWEIPHLANACLTCEQGGERLFDANTDGRHDACTGDKYIILHDCL